MKIYNIYSEQNKKLSVESAVFIKDGFKLPKKNYKYFNPGSTPGGWEHNDR